ncbi:MAG: hemolysin family protein [Pirellulales bacterium]
MVNADALLWIALASLAASTLAEIGGRALREFSRHQLQEICEQRQQLDRFGDVVRHHEEAALAAEMFAGMAITLFAVAGGIYGWERVVTEPIAWIELAAIAIVLAGLVAVAVFAFPWAIVRVGAERFLYVTWPFWRLLTQLAKPFSATAHGIESVMLRISGRPSAIEDEESFEEEIRTIVTEGHREGLLEEEAREMIEGVIELGDVVVSHVMTPRTEMHMLQAQTPLEEVVEYITEVGHTRIPVYDKSRDDVVGILYIKDLLPELAKEAVETRRPLVELLRKALFVPESKAVNDLLQLFQHSRTHLAIVLDEYGGVSGLVTIEDVLEEIVGEIEDEFDPEAEEDVRKIDDDTCEALGRAHVDQINALMGFDLPEEEAFDTIGGFVFDQFGRVPSAGESITWNDSVQVKVLEASRRRVGRVRLERIHQEAAEMA